MPPGAEGEVDFADLWIILRGVNTKVALFRFRLSAWGQAVHRAFATQGQEAFLEGHVYAFCELGWDADGARALRQLEGRGVTGRVRP